jgi:hypothetical protein
MFSLKIFGTFPLFSIGNFPLASLITAEGTTAESLSEGAVRAAEDATVPGAACPPRCRPATRRLSVDRTSLQAGRVERVMVHWCLGRDACVGPTDWLGLYLLGKFSQT